MNKNSKILITGGAGYIGSHVVKELLAAGYTNLVVIDDLSTGERKNVPQNVEFIKGDFGDKKDLEDIFAKEVKTVMHFAASKIAPESVKIPEEYYDNNVAKSIVFAKECVKRGVKNFIFSSSAAVYGDVTSYPITEDFETKPTNPYGWTKLMFEQVLSDISFAHGMRHVSLRYFNAAGADPEGGLGNNHALGEDVISILMTSARTEKPFVILGTDYDTKDGTCVRDLIHVSDLASAHVLALEYLEKGGESVTLNLGSEEGFTVREISNKTREITGARFEILEGGRRAGDIAVSIASSQKAQDLLHWEKKFSDMDILIRTAWEWENERQGK